MPGALLVATAVFCLLMALAPRAWRAGGARGLDLIRASTLDEPPARRSRTTVAHALLGRFAERVGLGPRWVSSQDIVEAGIDPDIFTPVEASALKLLLAIIAVAVSLLTGAALPGMLVAAPVMGWAAFVAPSAFLARRRARRRALVLAELPDVVGLLRAFTNAQLPLEQALHLVSAQMHEVDPGNILAAELRLALGPTAWARPSAPASSAWPTAWELTSCAPWWPPSPRASGWARGLS